MTSFWALFIIIIFLKKDENWKKKKRIKKRKKKKMKIWGHPLGQKWGGLAKGWLEPPPRLVWGWPDHPLGQGGGSATPKGPKKKKKKKKKKKREKMVKMGFELLEVARPFPMAWGQTGRRGW
jgi:hypothetical protein